MKAIVISRPGDAEVLKLEERSIPVPRPNEVLIKVAAAGLNGLDILQRKGKYPVPPGVPADIPGVEVSGTIVQCGIDVTMFKEGDAVCALLGGAGYAEYAVADSGSCLPVPKSVTLVEAAALPEAVFTVWHNVFQRGRLQEGESFLVHGGTSGIGVTAIQLAKAFGARVYATAGSDLKCRACTDLGAETAINYKHQDFEETLSDEGVDVILDMIGGDYVPKNINILKAEGRLVFINSKSPELKLKVFSVMQKRLTITGSTLRGRDLVFKTMLASEVLAHVWPLIEEGRFKPVIHEIFPLAEAVSAHRLMESSKHIGKLLLQI